MTPKEKASEIYWKFRNLNDDYYSTPNVDVYEMAKQNAIILADELINQFDKSFAPASQMSAVFADNYAFWFNVKNEIEKL